MTFLYIVNTMYTCSKLDLARKVKFQKLKSVGFLVLIIQFEMYIWLRKGTAHNKVDGYSKGGETRLGYCANIYCSPQVEVG